MGNSLQEQLLKLGLADEKRARKAKEEKRQQTKQQPKKKGAEPSPEAAEERRMWAQKEAEKAERDRELNRQKQEAAQRKAASAQIKQLIETHRLPKGDGDAVYNFVDGRKVKRIYVTEAVHRQLSNGTAMVAKLHGHYDIVPAAIADRIRERDPACVLLNEPTAPSQPDPDDPYAQYQVPDDLMW